MLYLKIIILITLILVLLFFLTTYICYKIVFYHRRNKKTDEAQYQLPNGKLYQNYKETFINWINEADSLPHEIVSVKTNDGLTLKGKYYKHCNTNVIELLFHGYRSNSRRDLSGGVVRCKMLNHNALVVDHRSAGLSEGNKISFGVNESKDLLLWINYIINNIDQNAKIILSGISMGASTVLLASDKNLPKNVIGILADCGYTSAEDIIKKVIKDLKLSPKFFYPFIKIGAKIYGRFNLDEARPIDTVKNSKLPILFIHGDADQFVPCQMSIDNYENCSSLKKLLIIKDAPHGLAFVIDNEQYLNAIKDFFKN